MKKSQAARVVEKLNMLKSDERIIEHYRKLSRIEGVSAAVFFWCFPATIVYAVCSMVLHTVHRDEFLAVGLAIVAVAVASAVTGFCVRTNPLFQPLAESDECGNALELVRAHQVARAIRDDALSRGRQLYVADAVLMEEARWRLFNDELEAEREEKRRAQCAELHGLTERAPASQG